MNKKVYYIFEYNDLVISYVNIDDIKFFVYLMEKIV